MIIYTKTVKEFGNELNKLIDMTNKERIESITAHLTAHQKDLAWFRDRAEFNHPKAYEDNDKIYNDWIAEVQIDINYLNSLLENPGSDMGSIISALDAEGIRPLY